MPELLADIFIREKSPQIIWRDETVYAIYSLALASNEIQIEFLSGIKNPAQGLTLKVESGMLAVNGVEAVELTIWNDTAPERVPVVIRHIDGLTPTLKFWNIWLGNVGGVDITQAWLGNSGMCVSQSADRKRVLLECSCGEGEVDFKDLVVSIVVE